MADIIQLGERTVTLGYADWVEIRDSRDGGSLRTQSVEAVLLFGILQQLQLLNAKETRIVVSGG